jgi:hypothetical protein
MSDPGRSRELPEDAIDPDQLLTNVSTRFLYEITHSTE